MGKLSQGTAKGVTTWACATASCDPNARAAAHVRHLAKTNKSQRNFDKKNRQFSLDKYNSGSCKECVREDVNPLYANHPHENCYRRANGALDRKGIKDKNGRTTEVIRLIQEKKKANAEKHAPKNPTKEGTSQVAISRVSIAIQENTNAVVKTMQSLLGKTSVPKKEKYVKDDKRWSLHQEYINPKRYIRSWAAVQNPLTDAEIDSLLPDVKARRQLGRRQLIRMHYERVNARQMLLDFRTMRGAPHPNNYVPEDPSYVPQLPRDRVSEQDKYQQADLLEPLSPYALTREEYVRYLRDNYGFTNPKNCFDMFVAIHTRWERNKTIVGDQYDKLRAFAKKAKWKGFHYPLPLAHTPRELTFPDPKNCNEVSTCLQLYSMYNMWYRDSTHFEGDAEALVDILEKYDSRRAELTREEN